MAEQAAGDTQGKMKRLSREMRNLHGKTALPVYMASSVFVRHDSDRMDKVRAMITGSVTPLGSLMNEIKIDCVSVGLTEPPVVHMLSIQH